MIIFFRIFLSEPFQSLEFFKAFKKLAIEELLYINLFFLKKRCTFFKTNRTTLVLW